jgi:hypothetical protein
MKTQFAGLMNAEKKQTARIAEQARILRTIVIVAGFGFFFVCLGFAAFLIMHRHASFR